MNKKLFILAIIVLIGIIGFCAVQLFTSTEDYREEESVHEEVMPYSPEIDWEFLENQSYPEDIYFGNPIEGEENQNGVSGDNSTATQKNPTINSARKDFSQDLVGWIKVKNTKIDYPFVQTDNNTFYLNHNIKGNKAGAGTIFLDYRCSRNFNDYNSILYGHHMKNKSMFQNLKLFSTKKFFENNKTGVICLDDVNYTIEFFAYIVIENDDSMIYNSVSLNHTKRLEFLDYVKNNARHYRKLDLTVNDKLVTLSTCAYEFNNARMVLIGRVLGKKIY